MSITFDGDRSRKLLWFAKKLLRQIKSMDLPSKALKYNGFLIKVWQMTGLSGGRITAPMGAVVAYSNYSGFQLCVADSWTGGFTGKSQFHGLTNNVSSGVFAAVVPNQAEDDMIVDGYSTFDYSPIPFESYYNLAPGGVVAGPSVYTYIDDPPTPWIGSAVNGEAFWFAYSATPRVDVLPYKDFYEVSLNSYNSSGNFLAKRVTALYEHALTLFNEYGSKALYSLPSNGVQVVAVQPQNLIPYNGDKIQALYFNGDVTALNMYVWYISTITQHLPAGLRALLLDPVNSYSAIGNYIFSNTVDGPPTMLTALDLTSRLGSDNISDWFDDNPGNDKWKLSYHFHTWGDATVYTVDSDSFLTLLDNMATTLNPAGSYSDAAWTMQQLFSRPNHDFSTPYDNSMWNDGSGNVYVWSRKYGSFRFDTTNISSVTTGFNPIIETTDGVRPTITHAGNGLYLCVGEDLTTPKRVKCIDYGTPYGAGLWNSLPLPANTVEDGVLVERYLVHVRPIEVSTNTIILLGVIEKIVDGAEGVYHFAFLRYNEGVGSWVEMGRIPVTLSDEVIGGLPMRPYCNWSVSLFGEGELVQKLGQYLTQPPVMTSMPIPDDYSGYASGMP